MRQAVGYVRGGRRLRSGACRSSSNRKSSRENLLKMINFWCSSPTMGSGLLTLDAKGRKMQ
jgi:hypothetical protein